MKNKSAQALVALRNKKLSKKRRKEIASMGGKALRDKRKKEKEKLSTGVLA